MFATTRMFEGLLLYPLLIISIVFHECAHALMAEKKGDDTPRLAGRLTLNPIAHIDPIGTFLLPLMALMFGGPMFGWAKPVPINPYNLGDPKKDMMLIALAGPLANLLLAGTSSFLIWFFGAFPNTLLYALLYKLLWLNVILAVFNLVPVPPLDGSKILSGILPYELSRGYEMLSGTYGILILIFLICSGVLWMFISPLAHFLLNLFTTGIHV